MLTIENVTFQYKKKRSLFEKFSLDLEPGSIVCLLGKNGAGKSTLLHLISGLVEPKEGSICVNGMDPLKRDPSFLNQLSLVPEEFFLPTLSIRHFVCARSDFYPSFDRAKMDDLLREFELDASAKLHQLSHGQRKKFLIAFTLATNCKLLILDEPTNGLDVPSKSQFRKVLVGSIREDQLVILSTHQVKDIDSIVDRILVIDQGRLLFNETVESINRSWLFETVTKIHDLPDVLYQESCPYGYKVIRPVTGSEETPMDLEVLFNAIIHQAL